MQPCTSCNTKQSIVYDQDRCEIIPEWEREKCECDTYKGYRKGQCVYICREDAEGKLVADIYTSLVDNNTTYPLDGVRDDPQTWVFRNICEALIPNPVVPSEFCIKFPVATVSREYIKKIPTELCL